MKRKSIEELREGSRSKELRRSGRIAEEEVSI
jgi:hypothetical protein